MLCLFLVVGFTTKENSIQSMNLLFIIFIFFLLWRVVFHNKYENKRESKYTWIQLILYNILKFGLNDGVLELKMHHITTE